MPRGKRKGRSDRNKNDGSLNSSEDESFENASVQSNFSEPMEDGEDADDLAQEQFEEKLCETLDGLTQKSSQGRINCFEALTKAFVKKYMPNFIRDRYFTICDSIEKSLKKGNATEKTAAAELATVVCVQLGSDTTNEDILKLLKPVLLTIVCDKTATPLIRAKCCTALGNLTFLSGGDIGEVVLLMQQLEAIFSGSYLKGDGNVPNISADVAVLHSTAILTWSLLFTLITPGSIGTMINNSKSLPPLEKFSELLESGNLEVRLAAGEALALIYESGRDENEEFEDDFAIDLIESLKQLATDSHKYRAKKDRKQQRATFRDILQFIQNNIVPELRIKVGKEILVLDSWTKRKHYESLCNIFGLTIHVYLAENQLLRNIFDMNDSPPEVKIPKYAEHQMERYKMDDTVPEIQVKFGKEVLMLDTWARRKQYDTLCTILGPGINIHLTENELLREIFEITGLPPTSDLLSYARNQKLERNRKRLLNAANFKARTISRAKNRDKRSDF